MPKAAFARVEPEKAGANGSGETPGHGARWRASASATPALSDYVVRRMSFDGFSAGACFSAFPPLGANA